MIIYVTKWALTKGILELDVELCESGGVTWGRRGWAYGEGKQWHRSRADALDQFERMRTAAIAAARKRIAKLEKMTARIVEDASE